MKRLCALVFAMLMALSLVACGGQKEPAATEEPLTDFELCAEFAVSQIREILKNPSSMAVNHIYGVEADDGYIFAVDYSAQNGFGGSTRDTTYITVVKIDNGFSIKTLGAPHFADPTNQNYTKQFYDGAAKSGYYEFDAETYREKTMWK